MICTSINNRKFDGITDLVAGCEMAEIRLDGCELTLQEIAVLFASDVPLVATCRIAEVMRRMPELNDIAAASWAEKRLIAAVEAGAAYVDVEMDAPKQMSKRVRNAAHESGAVFIRSYHDFEKTDSVEKLQEIADRCRYHGADVVKLVTTAAVPEDAGKVLSLYGNATEGSLIAFCMGDAGRQSRIECLRLGAPFTYAAVSDEEATAPGQWSMPEMMKAVYGDFRFIGHTCHPALDAGSVGQDVGNDAVETPSLQMPASKSFAQRAIIAAALAAGESKLHGYTPCRDSEAALSVAAALGAKVEIVPDGYGQRNDTAKCVVIKGIGAVPDCLTMDAVNVGESGLLARLMMPLCASLSAVPVTISGEGTLPDREMKGVREILSGYGVELSCGGEKCAVPLTVSGTPAGGKAEISGKNGSQLISGLLMTLPLGEKNSTMSVTDPKSIPYMFITLDVMRKFGVKVANDMLGGADFLESGGDWSLCSEIVFKVRGRQQYRAADFSIEGDWSAAAAFLVAGAIFGRMQLEGLDTSSLQADLTIMDVLMDAGASLSQTDGERGVIAVQRAPLMAFEIDASHCPDLFPILSVLALFCQGTSKIHGTDRLAHKECDRADAILAMLKQMGAEAAIEDNVLIVKGKSLCGRILSGELLKGGEYSSHHDHRMAMALAVASLGTESPLEIDDRECTAKSFPQFFEMFDSI